MLELVNFSPRDSDSDSRHKSLDSDSDSDSDSKPAGLGLGLKSYASGLGLGLGHATRTRDMRTRTRLGLEETRTRCKWLLHLPAPWYICQNLPNFCNFHIGHFKPGSLRADMTRIDMPHWHGTTRHNTSWHGALRRFFYIWHDYALTWQCHDLTWVTWHDMTCHDMTWHVSCMCTFLNDRSNRYQVTIVYPVFWGYSYVDNEDAIMFNWLN